MTKDNIEKLTREERVKRAIEIVSNNNISKHSEFIKKYKEKYGDISQATVARTFKYARIDKDKNSPFYTIHKLDKDIKASEREKLEHMLFGLLDQYSNGEISTKNIPDIILSVSPNSESIIAENIYKFCNGNVSTFYGYGCLLLKCHTISEYEKIKKAINEHSADNFNIVSSVLGKSGQS